MIDETWVRQLMTLGLSKYEARAYLALLGHDESSAVEVADRASVPRQRIYDVLAGLHDQGLVVSRDGRPARHTAREPKAALGALLENRRRQQRVEIERLATVVAEIVPELEPVSNGGDESDAPRARPARVQQREPEGGF